MADGNQRTTNTDKRGNSHDRLRRREYLIDIHGSPSRLTVRCHHCRRRVGVHNFEVDRFPVCGHNGGRYTRDNVVPACKKCNATRCHPDVGKCRVKRRSTKSGR